MATGSQAVELIAEATGIPLVTVDRVARVLKQAKPPLWPRSGQGGGRRVAHAKPDELVNILLALCAADPITSAPERIAEFKTLVMAVRHEQGTAKTVDLDQDQIQTGGQALGQHLSDLIVALAGGGLTEEERQACANGWSCTLDLGVQPTAVIGSPAMNGQPPLYLAFCSGQQTLPFEPFAPAPLGELSRRVTIRFYLMALLGDLYADTCRQMGLPIKPPPPGSGSTTPEPYKAEAAEAPPSTASGNGKSATKASAALTSTEPTRAHQYATIAHVAGGQSSILVKGNLYESS